MSTTGVDRTGSAVSIVSLRFGSDPGCDLVIADPSVSPEHATVVCAVSAAGVSYFVLDHASATGTYLNGSDERLTWARLEDNDVLRLGSVRVKFKALVGSAATRA